MSFQSLDPSTQAYLNQRAANYDDCSGEDIYNMLPEEIQGSDAATMDYMQGNPELGVEPREVMHIESEANGGPDTPDNLMLGPKSHNRSIGSSDMTEEDIGQAEIANNDDVETLMDHYGLEEEAGEALMSAADLTDSTIEGAETINATTEIATTAVEAGGESILSTAGEALVDGLVPAIIGVKVGTYVADQFEKPIDKIGYGAAATGGVVALAFTPPGTFAVGLFCAWKVANLGYKVYKKFA